MVSESPCGTHRKGYIMNKRAIAKLAVKIVGSSCVGSLAMLMVKANYIPTNLKGKIILGVGSFVIGFAASDLADSYLDTKVDEVYGTIDALKKTIAEANAAKQPVVIEEA